MERIISAHLREDGRLKPEPFGQKCIYRDDQFEVSIFVYQGIKGHSVIHQDLVCMLCTYVESELEILWKFSHTPKAMDLPAIYKFVVEKLEEEQKTPFHILRDAKSWCNIPFTEEEMSTFTKAGITYHQRS